MTSDEKVQYSLRMDRQLYEQIQTISRLKKSPMSRILLSAIEDHVRQQTRTLQQQLMADLDSLRKYAQDDPTFESAIAAVADAETDAAADSMEGKIFVTDSAEATGRQKPVHAESPAGSAAVDAQALEGFLENA